MPTTPRKPATRQATVRAKRSSPASKTTTAARKTAQSTAPTQVPARSATRAVAKAPAAKKRVVAAAKPVAQVLPKSEAPEMNPAKVEKVEKPKKPKLVRDSYTIPKAEYQAMEALKQRATALGQPPKKSEMLRAGIMALAGLSDAALLAALAAVPAIKTGRPKG
jgi:hypothetical protein